ncbi:hypothetical protein BACOVA_04710 [Bacteroides ovatus ATCC 8483]|uniref:Uncharacterized protein n=1 Tax=Bacteroides ovatus (strain ATCC 8483 / DSM 1896 / JCM 5824 / BCRC 10623 / CCUG 4943 / NCTC 11153) TaxID=411476 RepID=A0AAN3D2M2_BACO1|nr:hypothetical protein BACOVA_04710 [Bacteroides ovatus ATCC 8483]
MALDQNEQRLIQRPPVFFLITGFSFVANLSQGKRMCN